MNFEDVGIIPEAYWKDVTIYNPPIEWVKEKIEKAGTTMGSVHFNKRTDGTLRKMSYRLHVKHPSVAGVPKGLREEAEVCRVCGKPKDACHTGPYEKIEVKSNKRSKKVIDENNNQMTVLDANKVVRDKEGKVIGRGAWRTIPLEKVTRIANRGVKYNVVRDGGKLQVHLSE